MIRVQVLGRFTLEARGESVHALAAQPLRGSVFLYLAVEREVTREALVRMFWPDRDEDKARRLLSQTLYELKRLLGEDWFVAVGETVKVENVAVDTHAFDTASGRQEHDQVLALYEGRFLSDFQRFDSADFNAWVDRKAAHYDRLHRRARRERIKQLLADGDRPGALAVAQRWSELDPHEDEAHHRTIELLHELGRRSEALQTFETYAARLKEVDLVPLEDTRALAARVRASAPPPLEALPRPPVTSPAPPQPAAPAKVPPGSPWPRSRLKQLAVALSAVVLLSVAAYPMITGGPSDNELRSASLPINSGYDLSRVAVLYFDDHTDGRKLDYLAKGLTEALIQELTRVGALSVISRHGVKPYQNSDVPLDSIARALNVGTLVEGDVQQFGDTIRVSVNMMDARTMRRDTLRTLSRPLGSGFQLEDDAVREVGTMLLQRVGQQIQLQRIARGANNEEAYRLYQKADDFREQVLSANPRLRVADAEKYEFLLQRADSMLAKAVELDPRWVEPLLLRGWLALDRGSFEAGPESERSNRYLRAAIEFANAVLRRSEHAGAYELRAVARTQMASNVADGDSTALVLRRQAEDDLKNAVERDESRASAWASLSRLRQFAGSLQEAALFAERALEEDAFQRGTAQIINRLIAIEMDLNRFSKAERYCRDGHKAFPDDYAFTQCFLLLPAANPVAKIGMDSAYKLLATLRQADPARTSRDYTPVFREMLIARLWAKNARPDSARALLERARRAAANDPAIQSSLPFDAAHILLLVADTLGAVEELNRYIKAKPSLYDYVRNGVAFHGIANRLQPPQRPR